MLAGEAVPRKVLWPTDARLDKQRFAALPSALSAKVQDARIPVLLPNDPVLLASIRLVEGEHWYALWGQRAGATITLNASAQARLYPHVRATTGPHTMRGTSGFITQNEGIWSASWIEHGVAYDLGMECVSPEAPACKDDAALRELLQDLHFVGPCLQQRESAR